MKIVAAALLIGLLAIPASAQLTGPFAGKSEDDVVSLIDSTVASGKATAAFDNAMIKALGDDHVGIRVRERAAWALGELKVKSAVPALLKGAEHKGLLIRSAAVTALERLRPPSAVPVLLKIAQSDPILPLRQRTIVALGAFRSEKTIQPLVQLSSDPAPELRGASALAMSALQSKKNDFSQALKEMTADENAYVKERAERALEIAKGKTADVLNQLKSGDADIRFTAALYFEQKGRAIELGALKDAWNTESDDDVRDELQRAILTTKHRVQIEKRHAAARKARAAKAKAAGTKPAPASAGQKTH